LPFSKKEGKLMAGPVFGQNMLIMSDNSVLKVIALSKSFAGVKAVDDISLSIEEGKIIGLLGPNGAGKTTTINMILGILEPDGGTIKIFNKTGLDETRERLNFAAVYAHLPGNLTVRQNLNVFGLLYGVKGLKEKINSLLREFDLEKFADTKAGLLSSGEVSRLSLAKAVINDPGLLLLDEPTASLDPDMAEQIREKIKAYATSARAGVLWTSHNMKEIEAVCDRVLFLSHGKILLAGDPKKLPGEYGKKDLEELFIAIAREPLTLHNNNLV